EGALRRIVEHAFTILERTARPILDVGAEGGARMLTTGAEAVAAYGVLLGARHEGHRRRFRLCKRCERVLYTAPRRGGPHEVCASCPSAADARDQRKNLKDALDDAGCPE